MVWGVVLSPSLLVFAGVSLIGTLFVIMSTGLLGVWLCLELGFFGFIPILNGKSIGENESAVKYFIIQSVGSGILLMSFVFISAEYFMFMSEIFMGGLVDMMVVVGFLVKLGVFPMHFWFPSVMGSASWFSCFWLSVVQKLGPFWVMGGLGLSDWLLNLLILSLVVTSIIGAFGGLAQVQFRPLMAYSSLGQTGWMGLVVLANINLFIFYFFMYSMLLSCLLWGLSLVNSYGITGAPGWDLSKGLMFWVFGCSFFVSLSGLPPLAGSALKLMGVLILVGQFPVFLIILILSSMVSLYYYLSMFISGVVCVGSSKFTIYDSVSVSRNMSLVLLIVGVLNWFGGFPLFMLCGSLVL